MEGRDSFIFQGDISEVFSMALIGEVNMNIAEVRTWRAVSELA
jgi:hypothetical protein